MQLFIAVLTESEYVSTILKKFADNNYHGSVLESKSIRHALMDSVEPLPYFGGLPTRIPGQMYLCYDPSVNR